MQKILAIVALVVALFAIAPHAFASEGNERDEGRVADLLIER